jgi:hypothetical protein
MDIPTLATNIIVHITNNVNARVAALSAHKQDLEDVLGKAAPSEVQAKEEVAYRLILSLSSFRSRQKGIPNWVELDHLPVVGRMDLMQLNKAIATRNQELNKIKNYTELFEKKWKIPSSGRASTGLGVRSAHENLAGWLPPIAIVTKEAALQAAVQTYLKKLAGSKDKRVYYLLLVSDSPGNAAMMPQAIEDKEGGPALLKAKQDYYNEVFAKIVTTKGERAQLAWARYAISTSPQPTTYVEFDPAAGWGISRLLYDYMSDKFYITAHYQWVEGYNPFFLVSGLPPTL